MAEISLKRIPAFGIETKDVNARGVYQKRAVKEQAQKREILEKAQSHEEPESLETIAKRSRLMENARKIAECVPIIGIFVGLFSLCDFCAKGAKSYEIHFIERHLIAAFGIGFIVLPIADLIATLVRRHQAKKQSGEV